MGVCEYLCCVELCWLCCWLQYVHKIRIYEHADHIKFGSVSIPYNDHDNSEQHRGDRNVHIKIALSFINPVESQWRYQKHFAERYVCVLSEFLF